MSSQSSVGIAEEMQCDNMGSVMPHDADAASMYQHLMALKMAPESASELPTAGRSCRPQRTDNQESGYGQHVECAECSSARCSPRPGEGGALSIVEAAQQAAALLHIADQRPLECLLVGQPGALEPLCKEGAVILPLWIYDQGMTQKHSQSLLQGLLLRLMLQRACNNHL